MRKAAFSAVLLVFLAGCASQVDREAQAAEADAKAFCAVQRVQSGPMAAKIVWQGESATPSQLALGDFARPSDAPGLTQYLEATASCLDRAVSWTATYRPWLYPYANAAKMAMMSALADLMTGKSTFGGTNQRLAYIDAELEIQYANANGRQAELNQLAAAEQQANFAAALGNFQQGMQQLSPPAPAIAPSPVTFPAYVPQNCRTVFIGNVANTQCY